MEMFTVGNAAIRISNIIVVQRLFEYGKYILRIRLKDFNRDIDANFPTKEELNNAYEALMDLIEEN